jgi:hypothetical protein
MTIMHTKPIVGIGLPVRNGENYLEERLIPKNTTQPFGRLIEANQLMAYECAGKLPRRKRTVSVRSDGRSALKSC